MAIVSTLKFMCIGHGAWAWAYGLCCMNQMNSVYAVLYVRCRFVCIRNGTATNENRYKSNASNRFV